MVIRDALYCVDDIARYIINYSNNRNYSISNLKLQKLLYFVQANFLINYDGLPCFREEIEAWDFGPVVPQVYREYREYGSGHILPIKYVFKNPKNGFGYEKVPFYEGFFRETCHRELVEKVVDYGTKYTALELVDLTHNQKPWKNAYMRRFNCIISKEAIYDCFKR